MRTMWNRRAQTTLEYAVLAAVVVGALLVMQIYMKRGFSGKLKESADRAGEQFTPRTATYTVQKNLNTARTEETFVTGRVDTTSVTETQTRTTGAAGEERPVRTDMRDERLFN